MQGMVNVLGESFTVNIYLCAVFRCPRLRTQCFPFLQFLGLPIIDMLNDGEGEQLMMRESEDLLFHLWLLGVIFVCSGDPESQVPLQETSSALARSCPHVAWSEPVTPSPPSSAAGLQGGLCNPPSLFLWQNFP